MLASLFFQHELTTLDWQKAIAQTQQKIDTMISAIFSLSFTIFVADKQETHAINFMLKE